MKNELLSDIAHNETPSSKKTANEQVWHPGQPIAASVLLGDNLIPPDFFFLAIFLRWLSPFSSGYRWR